MKKYVVNKIMFYIKKNNKDLDDIKFEEIRYGLLGLYSLITKTLFIIILSLLLNMFKEFIIFFIFYTILRALGYGVHAKSNFACWIVSPLLLLGIPYLFSRIELNNNITLIIWTVCFINYCLFCPADTEKRPMISKRRKLKFKCMILITSILYLYLIFKFNKYSNFIVASLILEAFLTNPLGYIIMGHKVRFKLNDIYLFKQCRKGGI